MAVAGSGRCGDVKTSYIMRTSIMFLDIISASVENRDLLEQICKDVEIVTADEVVAADF